MEEDAPTIQDVQYVASYNWLNGTSPVILVPGQYRLVSVSESDQILLASITCPGPLNIDVKLLWLIC